MYGHTISVKHCCLLVASGKLIDQTAHIHVFLCTIRNWSNASLKADAPLWAFCLYDLPSNVNAVLKCPAIIVLLSISPFRSVNNHYVYFDAPVLDACIYYKFYFFMDCPLHYYIFSIFVSCYILWLEVYYDMSMIIAALFWLLFAWSSIFHTFSFSLYLFLELRRVSWRQLSLVLSFNPSSHSVSFDWWIKSIYI